MYTGRITAAFIKISDTDTRYRYHDASGLVIEGFTKGGTPRNVRWRRNNRNIRNNDNFRIGSIEGKRNSSSCLERVYSLQLQGKGNLTGSYYFTTNNYYTPSISSNTIIVKGNLKCEIVI